MRFVPEGFGGGGFDDEEFDGVEDEMMAEALAQSNENRKEEIKLANKQLKLTNKQLQTELMDRAIFVAKSSVFWYFMPHSMRLQKVAQAYETLVKVMGEDLIWVAAYHRDMATQIEVITAEVEPTKEQITNIGTEAFIKAIHAEFNKPGFEWRNVASLASALHVDVQQLSDWLDKDSKVVRRAGKSDGTIYYALADRVNKSAPPKTKQVIREEDRYALGMLHMVYFQLHTILKTYGLEISQKDIEAFGNFTASLDKLESGLLLFSKKTKASMKKLPKFN
jgi:hypothetical protein